MKEIKEAILGKVRTEAREIVDNAEEEARRIIDGAKARRDERFTAEREKLQREAEGEAARITTRGKMDARNAVAAAKAEAFDAVVEKARTELRAAKPDVETYARLIAEAVGGLGSGAGITVTVPTGCGGIAAEALKKDERTAERVAKVEEDSMEGGILAESEDGSIVVDNTYGARLEMLLPRVYIHYASKLFGGADG
ncbi:MAG: V-type ATP synthase subunit E [Opitutales bacterium]|nr:V-type ATP synthase subunit E [Opitutales bacterium]